ncbi:MAG: AAA family ATPase [Acidobacteria bacterium]|nr:AAA family ATPase [Acidobacteriota bacterium]
MQPARINTGPTLVEQVRSRVDADERLPVEAGLLVMAALEGDTALAEALDAGGSHPTHTEPAGGSPTPSASNAATGVFVNRIAVQGFRGIGPCCRLELTPGPGLTLVVGRNGSGKSSFAEALELLLTGENRRWADRSAVWKQGWRNLHSTESAEIETTFTIEGERQPLVIGCTWPAGETDLEATTPIVRGPRHGDGRSALGWDGALSTYRPLLPYNELGSIADRKPSDLFDMMSAALGIESLVDARKRLRDQRLPRERQCKDIEADCKDHRDALDGLDDDRARECGRAIARPKANAWDLETLELVLQGAIDPGGDGEIPLLRRLASLPIPSAEAVEAAAAQLEAAVESARALAATDAGRASQLADILQQSLNLHAAHGDQPCPVCRDGALDGAWRARTEAEVERLRQEADAALKAHRALQEARRRAHALFDPLPPDLQHADEVGVDAAGLTAAWTRWNGLPADATDQALIEHFKQSYAGLADAAATLRGQAEAEIEQREDVWRPVATALREWLPDAKEAALARETVPNLKKAEKWLDTETGRVRTERFQPIAAHARKIWELLRQNSAVALDDLELAGGATQRRLDLGVSVDGVSGQALGVMSQGEIHALALSLFLPRVLLPQSPFGFVVIDDPVQAMDPGKVDGLARVLQMAARTRQVIVFTHDERLPESIRRLQIPARVVEVTRHAQSVVDCRETRDPATQYLHDARSLTRTDDLPPAAAARAVPLYCRLALEAACTEVVRRRRIGRGEAHAAVEETLTDARKLLQKLALALFDDAERAGDVLPSINAKWGRSAGDAVTWSNRGSHDPIPAAQLEPLVDDTSRTVRSLLSPARPR